jgi:hypothetical protein
MLHTDTEVLFLDIDGVTSPFWKGQLDANFFETRAWGMGVIVIPAVIDRINALHRSGVCQVQWLTTWDRAGINSFEQAVGLDHFESHERYVERTRDEQWWKESVVLEYADQTTAKFAWADDEISDLGSDRRLEQQHPGRGIYPSPHKDFGLRVEDFDRIEAHFAG